jgi:hypothetical protein
VKRAEEVESLFRECCGACVPSQLEGVSPDVVIRGESGMFSFLFGIPFALDNLPL